LYSLTHLFLYISIAGITNIETYIKLIY